MCDKNCNRPLVFDEKDGLVHTDGNHVSCFFF